MSAGAAAIVSRRRGQGRVWKLMSVLGLLVLAVFPRLNGLAQDSLDVDEYLHVFSAQEWLRSGEPLLPSGNVYSRAKPYTALTMASFKVLGAGEWSARLPSVIAGMFVVLATYLIGRQWFGRAAGLLAGVIVAIGPLPVMTSRLCRMYSSFELVYLLAVYGTWQWVLRPRLPLHWRAAGALLSAGLLLASLQLQALAQVFVLAFAGFLCGIALVRPKSLATATLIGGLLAVGAAFLLGVVEPAAIWEKMNHAPAWAEKTRFRLDFYWVQWRKEYPALMLASPLLLAWLVWRRRLLGWYLAAMAVVPFALHSAVFDWKFGRYVAHVFPLFALAVAPGLAALAKALWRLSRGAADPKKRAAAGLGLAVLAAAVFWPALKSTVLRVPEALSPDWREAFAYVEHARQPGEVLLTSMPLAGMHYLRHGAVDYYIDDWAFKDFRERMKQDERGWWIDWYSGLPMITADEEWRRVVEAAPAGWLVVDKDRWEAGSAIPEEFRKWLVLNAAPHHAAADGSVVVYRFQR